VSLFRLSDTARLPHPDQSQIIDLQEARTDPNTSSIAGDNVFAVLMDAVRVCSLGQITNALFEVGGQYRRSM
jgi:methylmalonyl-CoA mutase